MYITDKGYIVCQKCGYRTKVKVIPKVTVLVHFPLYCKTCREEFIIDYN